MSLFKSVINLLINYSYWAPFKMLETPTLCIHYPHFIDEETKAQKVSGPILPASEQRNKDLN